MRTGFPRLRRALASFVILAGLATSAQAQTRDDPQAQGTDFYIVNNGPRAIEQVFISQSGDRSWGKSRLSGRAIAAGESALFRNTVRDGCQGDVRVVFEGGGQMERRNQNLCRINRMYFTAPTRSSRRGASDMNLRNESDEIIEGIYITRAGDRDWGRNWLARGDRDRKSTRLNSSHT